MAKYSIFLQCHSEMISLCYLPHKGTRPSPNTSKKNLDFFLEQCRAYLNSTYAFQHMLYVFTGFMLEEIFPQVWIH